MDLIDRVFDDTQRTHTPVGSSLCIHRCRIPHILEAKQLNMVKLLLHFLLQGSRQEHPEI